MISNTHFYLAGSSWLLSCGHMLILAELRKVVLLLVIYFLLYNIHGHSYHPHWSRIVSFLFIQLTFLHLTNITG